MIKLLHPLSVREEQIMEFLAVGAKSKEIAFELGIAVGTVKVHIKSLMRKLGVPNRTAAACWWVTQKMKGVDAPS